MTLQQPAPHLGVIEMPQLARALSAAGVDVVGGGEFRESGGAINAALSGPGARFPVLVANLLAPPPGMITFVDKLAPSVPVMIVNLGARGPLMHPLALEFDLPSTFGQLLTALHLPVDPATADTPIAADGSLPSAEPPAAVSPWDTFATPPEPSPEPPAPVSPWQTLPAARPAEPVEPPPPPQAEPPRATAPTPVLPWTVGTQDGQPRPTPSWLTTAQTPEPAPVPTVERVAPARTETPPASAAPVVEVFEPEQHTTEPDLATPRAAGRVLVVFGGSGGVTKTTTSRNLAQRAASAGLRTVLVDANEGQGDQRKFLRLGSSALPTAYDVAAGTPARDVICSPSVINAARSSRLSPVGFALVMAPPPEIRDPELVTPEVYRDIIDAARSVADLVVVDTQTLEAGDASRRTMAGDLIVPEMLSGALGLGLARFDRTSVSNLASHLTQFVELGVDPERLLVAITMVPADIAWDRNLFAPAFGSTAELIGSMTYSEVVTGRINAGRIEHEDASVAATLDAILARATGNAVFDQPLPAPRRGGLGSLFRGRR